MKTSILFLCISLCMYVPLQAQIGETFADGNFSSNPTWVGGNADWVVNSGLQLQSNNVVANSTYYISTASTLATTAQWEFYCNLTFNTSSTNYADVYLTASAADVSLATTTGYFVRIGNTTDEVCLYKKDALGTITKIIDGVDGVTNVSNNILKIKVVRSAANLFTLSRDVTGVGNAYFTEGSITDNTYNSSAFFGILIKQSTASFFQRHYFDDIQVQPFVPDVTPPSIVSVTALSPTLVDVLYNEPVELASSQTTTNYSASNSLGSPATALRDATNTALVHLSFATNIPARTNITLTINGVADVANNVLTNAAKVFSYFVPQAYDIVIAEILADPTPIIALPNNEWLELQNTTAFDINLQNYRLGKATGESGPMPAYLLAAGQRVIICTGSAVAAMSIYGPTLAVASFPSLNNDADKIYLRAPQGTIIHSVQYSIDWYKNELKKDGGWSLEMIDTNNPCTGINNWAASIDARGGSPAAKNSIDAVNKDATAPKLLRAFANNTTQITLVFTEPLDSAKAALAGNYTLSDGIGISTALPLSVSFDKVQLTFSTALAPNKTYLVTANNLTDCSGNIIGVSKQARVGLTAPIDTADIVVNEILFNPKPNGVDYVELYNRSNKILNLKNSFIASRNSLGAVANIYPSVGEDYLLFPNDYIVLTESIALTKRDYVCNNPDALIQLGSLPSFNDTEGSAIILNEQGKIIDEVTYTNKWHFALISNEEAVALERIHANAASVQSNFTSAASSVGFGTPTYKNSQNRVDAVPKGSITITPDIVSPDNDGRDDFATLQYNFTEPGIVANITIFDAAGRPVRYLQRNALCGTKGSFVWDGLGEKQQKLPQGMYVIFTEIFNQKGQTNRFKQVIVLARQN